MGLSREKNAMGQKYEKFVGILSLLQDKET